MYSFLLPNLKVTLKYISYKYLCIKYSKKKLILKNIYVKLFKKNILFFLNLNSQNIFIINFFKKLFYFLKGFNFFFTILGKRFKFFINKEFLFFKMDTSKYFFLKMVKNILLKKKKKIIIFFFFDILIFQFLKKILKLKKPNKYTKKGITTYINN